MKIIHFHHFTSLVANNTEYQKTERAIYLVLDEDLDLME